MSLCIIHGTDTSLQWLSKGIYHETRKRGKNNHWTQHIGVMVMKTTSGLYQNVFLRTLEICFTFNIWVKNHYIIESWNKFTKGGLNNTEKQTIYEAKLFLGILGGTTQLFIKINEQTILTVMFIVFISGDFARSMEEINYIFLIIWFSWSKYSIVRDPLRGFFKGL